MTEYSVGVRALAAFCFRSGDIDQRFTPSPTGEQGVEGHREVYRRRPDSYQSEFPVQHRQTFDGLTLLLRGRADGYDRDAAMVEEIKTCRVAVERIPESVSAMHMAQGKLYAALIAQAESLAGLTVRLTWFHLDSAEEHSNEEYWSAEALAEFLADTLAQFSAWLHRLSQLRLARDNSVTTLTFPYSEFRSGQREMAELVYKCCDQAGDLLLEAPTGIGKTAAVLYPALKAQSLGKFDKLVFVTARSVGRLAAEQTLSHFRAAGFQGLALSLSARERVCLSPGKACHADDCPYAEGYYDRLPRAMLAALEQPCLRREELEQLAREFTVCPYQLAMDLLPWVDLVIADLFYLFSPGGGIAARGAAEGERWSVLLDEAHNLPGRARDMYSARLRKDRLLAAKRDSEGVLKKALERCNRAMLALSKAAWPTGEPQSEGDHHTLIECPPALQFSVSGVLSACGEALAQDPLYLQARPALQDFFFDLLQFQRILELWGDEYRLDLERGDRPQSLVLKLNCLDAARLLRLRRAPLHALCAFSATLSPPNWMADSLGLSAGGVQRQLPSPFLAEQLQVELETGIDTRYRARAQSLPRLAAVIEQWLESVPGNCIVYFPGYRYMEDCLALLPPGPAGRALWRQQADQDDASRAELLQRLNDRQDNVAFCVLGGVFGEGVDLPGELLTSVVVVGVGLPAVDRDTEIRRGWYGAQGRDGFDCAYRFPGMQKVAQALGRVVRNEQDHGKALLIDPRYAQREYRALLPPAWDYRERR